MRIFKLVFWGVVWALIAAFLHYTLPRTDVVRIVDTEIRRVDPGANAIFWARPDVGSAAGTAGRDVRFVSAFTEGGRARVYRNEDTGWGWPPYFKLDSSNLQAEARDLISAAGAPAWVAVRYYGWRSELLTIFPNMLSVRPVAGPDVRIVPWTNIVVLILLFAVAWAIAVRWRRFRRARIDPTLDRWGAAWDVRRARAQARYDAWRSARRTRPRP